jgi:hypothetical protein
MTTARERYLMTERGRAAVRRAAEKQEAKRKEYAADKREMLETYKRGLIGLTKAEIAVKMKQYKTYMKLREEQTRARGYYERQFLRQERSREQLEAKIKGERARVNRLIEDGVVEVMTPEEKAEWIELCRQRNPIMYDVLREKGVA